MSHLAKSSDARRPLVWLECALLVVVAAGLLLQVEVGKADNGDFTRLMACFSSGPVGQEPNWPLPGSEQWRRRFFHYWIPAWKLDFPGCLGIWSSAMLLWLPGILFTHLVISSSTLWLPVVAVFPKLILVGVLWPTFRWIETSELTPAAKHVLALTLGLPSAAILVAPEYAAYLHSFYQESGSYVFLLAFLAALVLAARMRRRGLARLACILTLLLLGGARAANIYWLPVGALMAAPWLAAASGRWKREAAAGPPWSRSCCCSCMASWSGPFRRVLMPPTRVCISESCASAVSPGSICAASASLAAPSASA